MILGLSTWDWLTVQGAIVNNEEAWMEEFQTGGWLTQCFNSSSHYIGGFWVNVQNEWLTDRRTEPEE